MHGDAVARVPTCPDWTLRDLATHVGQVMGFWTHLLCEGTGRPKPQFDDQPGPAAGLWFLQVAGPLVAELKAATADTNAWTCNPHHHSPALPPPRIAPDTSAHP